MRLGERERGVRERALAALLGKLRSDAGNDRVASSLGLRRIAGVPVVQYLSLTGGISAFQVLRDAHPHPVGGPVPVEVLEDSFHGL